MTDIESTVSQWSGVQVEAHDRGGREFTLAGRELGHVHPGRVVDIPFSKRIRDILIEEKQAEKHHIFPDSGWVSSYINNGSVERALWLLRVSYLHHAISLRHRDDSEIVTDIDFEQELEELNPSENLQAVFDDLLERTARSS